MLQDSDPVLAVEMSLTTRHLLHSQGPYLRYRSLLHVQLVCVFHLQFNRVFD